MDDFYAARTANLAALPWSNIAPPFIKLYIPNADGTQRIIEAGCMAHARRKFHDIHVSNGSPIAKEALKRIGALYDIERAIRGQSPERRLAVRQEKAQPLLDNLETWLLEQRSKLPRKSDLAGAIRYMQGQWAALCLYVTDGTVEIDNNAAERAVKPVAIGRKNYLFVGSDAGGEEAAGLYSLIQTAKMNGINPEEYLADVFARIADFPVKRIHELLPWNWKNSKITENQ